jgi:NTP pyrophosphatase (non-canonical NTP hydrolase)
MNEETKEILIILQEECGETIQNISKCMRFGIDQVRPGTDKTNMQHLQQELGDVLAMIELLYDQEVGITVEGLQDAADKKFQKLKRWSNLTINK